MDDFIVAVERLLNCSIPRCFTGDFGSPHLAGFVGAAAVYAFSLLYPERVSSTAGLAGFMPEGARQFASGDRLKGLPVFVTHGTQDALVPVERGRESARVLEEAGALVTYCEDDVGHKLSATCFRGLENFYKNKLISCD
jgi:phospholipase/carboxylesterase